MNTCQVCKYFVLNTMVFEDESSILDTGTCRRNKGIPYGTLIIDSCDHYQKQEELEDVEDNVSAV